MLDAIAPFSFHEALSSAEPAACGPHLTSDCERHAQPTRVAQPRGCRRARRGRGALAPAGPRYSSIRPMSDAEVASRSRSLGSSGSTRSASDNAVKASSQARLSNEVRPRSSSCEASTTGPRYATNGRGCPVRILLGIVIVAFLILLGAGRDRRVQATRPLGRRQGGLDDLHADRSVHRAARVHDAAARERLAGRALKIVGLGGSLATHSRSRRALETALTGALEADAQTELFDIRALDLALYNPEGEPESEHAGDGRGTGERGRPASGAARSTRARSRARSRTPSTGCTYPAGACS